LQATRRARQTVISAIAAHRQHSNNKYMRKLLLSCLAFVALSLNAQTTFKVGVVSYTTTGDATCEVSDVDSKDASGTAVTEVSIPQTVENEGATYTVTALGEYAFNYSDVSSVTLPETIETVGRCAFNSCKNLTQIALPAGLKTIGDYAFSGAGLTSIDIPASVEEIGGSAFFTNYSLADITGMQGLKKIGGSAFYKCPITEITLPEAVDSIPKSLFLYCDKLQTVNLSSSTYYIGEGAFNGCTSLASMTIPSSVKHIGDEAFLGCSALTSFTLPASTAELGTGVLAKSGVTTLAVEDGCTNFELYNGAIYSADKRLLYAVPMKGMTSHSVQSGCVGINGGAFWGSEVQQVTLPDGLAAIDDYAFCQSSLAQINFPSSLVYMGVQALADTKLTEVTLPENMTTVYEALLAGCTELTTVTIPSAVKIIAMRAFWNCTKLKTINALGSTAPELEEIYEDYESQFYNVSGATIYVPKGSSSSYEAAGYGDKLTISETDAGTLKYTSTNPADGSTVEPGYMNMAFDVVFDEAVTIVKDEPEAILKMGDETIGSTIEPYGSWHATNGDNANTLRVWGDDGDGYTDYFKTEDGKSYCIIIPAGMVKNAAGDLNERIVIHWNCTTPEPTAFEYISTSPADGASIEPGYFNFVFDVVFDEAITIAENAPQAHFMEGDETNGTEIEPYGGWHANKGDDANTLRVWGDDGDGFTDYTKLADGKSYCMVIPAGVVKNADGAANEQILIHINCTSATAIEGTGASAEPSVAGHYAINGQRASAKQRGINILRMSDGSVRKVVVR